MVQLHLFHLHVQVQLIHVQYMCICATACTDSGVRLNECKNNLEECYTCQEEEELRRRRRRRRRMKPHIDMNID